MVVTAAFADNLVMFDGGIYQSVIFVWVFFPLPFPSLVTLLCGNHLDASLKNWLDDVACVLEIAECTREVEDK